MSRRVEVFILGDSKSGQKAFRDLDRAAARSESKLEQTSKKMQRVGTSISQNLSGPLALAAGGAVAAFGSLDSKLTQSAAIMSDVDGAMRTNMAETAKQVSTDLNLAAADAAEGYFFLASAGMDAAQSVAAMPQVAAFAKAGMFDLATATDLATDAQSALGLSSDDAAENLANLTRVTDVFAKANILANTSIQQVSEAITNKAGAALRVMNKDVEEGVAVLAALADQGVKGAAAGEALSIVLRDVSRAAARNVEGFEELGIEIFDADGNMRHMADVVADMEGAFGGMSDATMATTLEQLGLTRSVGDVIKMLLGTSDAIREYDAAARDAGGTTQAIADKQMEAFNEQLGVARQRLVNAAGALGEQLAPAILTGANAVASLIEGFAALPGPIRNTVGALLLLTAASGPAFVAGGKLLGTYVQLNKTLRGLRTAQTLTHVGTGIEAIGASAVASSRGLGVMAAIFSPAGALVAGLAAVAAGFYLLKRRADAASDANETATEAAQRLAESAGLAYQEIEAAAADAGDGAEASMNQFVNANSRAIGILQDLDAASQRAYLINVGWELTQHGADPEQAFAAIQRLADAAGVEIPVDLDADDLDDLDEKLKAIARDAELVGQQLALIDGGIPRNIAENIEPIAQAAADAFAMDDIAGATAMLVEFDRVIQEVAPNQRQAGNATNHLVDRFRKLTEVQGLNTSGNQDLAEAMRDMVNEEAILHDSTRDVIEAFVDVIDAGGTTEEALAAMDAAAAELAATEGDVEGATGDAADAARDHADAMGEEEGASAELEEQTKETKSAIEQLRDAERAAVEPVYALLSAVEAVDKAEQNYADTLADKEATEADRSAAAVEHAQALSRLEAAATDGSLSFETFERKLEGWVSEGRIVADEAARIRDRVAEARGEFELLEGQYPIDIEANTAAAIRAVNDLKLSLSDALLVAAAFSRSTGSGFTATSGGNVVPTGVVRHSGGLVDGSGPRRPLGSVRGDEQAVIARRGEEVLRQDNPRHINNVGRGAGGLTREDLHTIAWAIRDGISVMRIDIRDNGVARDLTRAAQTASR